MGRKHTVHAAGFALSPPPSLRENGIEYTPSAPEPNSASGRLSCLDGSMHISSPLVGVDDERNGADAKPV